MNVLGDLVARERRSSHPAFVDRKTGNSISYHDFCTTAYKAGNVLRYLGVREGVTVAVVGSVGPQPLWAFYGAAQLGAVTAFVEDTDEGATLDPRVLLVPAVDEAGIEPAPGTKLAVYGDAPTHPTTLHWEKELWSENPAVHPTAVASSDTLLAAGTTHYSHAEVLDAARTLGETLALDAETTVAVRGSLSSPAVVTAGLVAPILTGGTVVAPTEAASADVAVVGHDTETAPEPRVCRVGDVPL